MFFSSCWVFDSSETEATHTGDGVKTGLRLTSPVSNGSKEKSKSSCLVVDYCNSLLYGIADIDLAKLQACTESTGSPGDKVSFIYSQSSTTSFSSLVASKV